MVGAQKDIVIEAIECGIRIVKDLKDEGYGIIATGEMGIGNTTTSSAIAAVLLSRDVEEVTGRGAGLSSIGLDKKINALVENAEREGKRQRIAEMTDFLNEQSCELEEYDEQLVRRLIEKVTVFDEKMTIEFKSGVTIEGRI